MSAPEKKPSYNAGRRIRWLLVAVVVVAIAYTAGWFWAAGQVDAAVDAFEANRSDRIEIACPGQQVRGYPFRIGVFCDRLELATADGQIDVSGGAVRSAAQVYDPRTIIAELDAPVVVRDAATGRSYTLTWDNARTSLVTAPTDAQRVGIEAEQAALSAGEQGRLAAADRFSLFARMQGTALDIAARPRGLSLDPSLTAGRALPAVGLDIDVRLDDWQTDWAGPVPQGSGTANRLALLLTDDRGIIVDGPFSLSAEGLLSGEFSVRVVDVPGVLAVARETFPELAPQIEALAASTPTQEGEPEDELTISLTVREGRVFAGIIPVGRMPPLRLGGLSAL